MGFRRQTQGVHVQENKPTATDPAWFVASVEKAFQVLRAFETRQRSLGLTEIAEATGLDKSSVQRFTYTLAALGYLKKDQEARRYTIAPKILSLGMIYLRTDSLVARARHQLYELNKAIDATVNLTDRRHRHHLRRPLPRPARRHGGRRAGHAAAGVLHRGRTRNSVDAAGCRRDGHPAPLQPGGLHRVRRDLVASGDGRNSPGTHTWFRIDGAREFARRHLDRRSGAPRRWLQPAAVNVSVSTTEWKPADVARKLGPTIREVARAVSETTEFQPPTRMAANGSTGTHLATTGTSYHTAIQDLASSTREHSHHAIAPRRRPPPARGPQYR